LIAIKFVPTAMRIDAWLRVAREGQAN